MSKQSNSDTTPTRPPDEELVAPKKIRRKKRRRSRIGKLYTKFRRHFRFGIAFIFIVTVAASGAMVMSVRISEAAIRLDASWQQLDRVLISIAERQGNEISLEEYPRLSSGISDLGSNLESMQKQIGYVAPIFDLDINEEWEISSQLVDSAGELTDGAGYMLDGIGPIVAFLQRDENSSTITTQISDGEQVVDLLKINQVSFRDASTSLNASIARLNAIDLSSATVDQILIHNQLTVFHQQLTKLNAILLSGSDILSQFMGLEQEATYLILALNNDSLRPSGGQVEAYGWFRVRNGRITSLDFSPSTFSSPVPPSPSFADTISIPGWWIAYESPLQAAWSGSWHADFSSTARMALDYYNTGGNFNAPVDGVIAIDLQSMQEIVGVLGWVDVPTLDEPLTAANFRETIYNPNNFGIQSPEQYLATIYKAVFEDMETIDRGQSTKLLTAMIEGLTQNHIMVYSPDPDTQGALNILGWSGAQQGAGANDYIMVTDTNLSNKSNHSVVHSLTYNVEIFPDQSRMSDLSVRYDYFDSFANSDPAINPEFFGPRDYTTQSQIYIPGDSVILEESNTIESSIVDWNDYTLLVTQQTVDYDSSERINIVYETPATADRIRNLYRYRLLVEKQPGLQIQDLELQVKLPPNANVITISQEPSANYLLEQPVFDFRLQMLSDQWIEFVYSLD